jgi:hypothetical protein
LSLSILEASLHAALIVRSWTGFARCGVPPHLAGRSLGVIQPFGEIHPYDSSHLTSVEILPLVGIRPETSKVFSLEALETMFMGAAPEPWLCWGGPNSVHSVA